MSLDDYYNVRITFNIESDINEYTKQNSTNLWMSKPPSYGHDVLSTPKNNTKAIRSHQKDHWLTKTRWLLQC